MIRTQLRSARARLQALALKKSLEAIRRGLESSNFPQARNSAVRKYRDSTIVLECVLDGMRIAFDVEVDESQAKLSVVGRTEESSRVLRNAFIGVGLSVHSNGERIILATFPLRPSRQKAVDMAVVQIRSAMDRMISLPGELHPERELGPADVLTYWWDTKANFGDTIGPWLVSRITGRRPVNSRWISGDRPSLFTVGSVIGHLNRPGDHIWGSGLIGRPGASKLEQLRASPPQAIHAVRGKKTRDALIQDLGWEVPEVYGDPALLLPRYYEPKPVPGAGKIGLVPHYKHKKLFGTLSSPTATIINVAAGLETVVDQIAGSSAVISTSLHGLIIAQSYGIPWVWMCIEDKQLGGGDFKFEDFFSLLDRDQVASVVLNTEQAGKIEATELAAQARLPRSFYDLDLLNESFPAYLFSHSQMGSESS